MPYILIEIYPYKLSIILSSLFFEMTFANYQTYHLSNKQKTRIIDKIPNIDLFLQFSQF